MIKGKTMNTINKIKDQVWAIVRNVEHRAYHAQSSHEVLYDAANEVQGGRKVLGLELNELPVGRNADFYKGWIQDECKDAMGKLGAYEVRECSMSESLTPFTRAQGLLPDAG